MCAMPILMKNDLYLHKNSQAHIKLLYAEIKSRCLLKSCGVFCCFVFCFEYKIKLKHICLFFDTCRIKELPTERQNFFF